jgi:hypothetical protein
MKVKALVLTAADTAFVLRAKLGPLRSWPTFLSDGIRGRQDIAGHRLLPCCRRRERRAYRPAYALTDIEEFVRNVLAEEPAAGKIPITAAPVVIDTSLGWRANKIDARGRSSASSPFAGLGASAP